MLPSPRSGRLRLLLAIILMSTFALTGISPTPAHANIGTIVAADAAGSPVDSYESDEAIYALAVLDIMGGRVCVVADPNTDTCEAPAFGTKNYLTGIGTMHALIEAPYLKPGTYYLLAETFDNGLWVPTALSDAFTVTSCEADGARCDRTVAMQEVAAWKAASAQRTAGGTAFCTAFKVKEAFDKATAIATGDFPGMALDYIREKLGLDALTPQELALKSLNIVSCNIALMHEDIVNDPPDPNFTQLATVEHLPLDPASSPDEQRLLTALEDERAIAAAMLTSYERYLGALDAGDVAWQARHARATGEFGLQLVAALRESDAALGAFLASTDPAATALLTSTPIETEAVRLLVAEVTARIVATGFNAEETAELNAAGLDADDLAELRRQLGLVDADQLTAGRSVGEILEANRGDIEAIIAGTEDFALAALTAADLIEPKATIKLSQDVYDTTEGGTVWFTPTVTVPTGESYTLHFDYGNGVSGRTPGAYYQESGSYTVTATVTSTSGLTATTTAIVNVENGPPLITIYWGASGGAVVPPGVQRDFVMNARDLGNDEVTDYQWDFGDGNTASGRTASHTWTTPGTYTLTASATDAESAVGSKQMVIEVRDYLIDLGPDHTVDEGTKVVFYPSGDVASTGYVEWDLGDGTRAFRYTGYGRIEHLYVPGSYTATISTVDGSYSRSDSAQVTVNNVVPTDLIVSLATRPVTDEPATLLARWTDPGDHSKATVSWTFADGSTQTGTEVSYAFPAGTHEVKVRVDDGYGGSIEATRTVTTIDPLRPGAIDSQGQDFWLAFGPNHDISAFDRNGAKLALYITADQDTVGGGSIPQLGWGFDFEVRAGEVAEVIVPTEAMRHGRNWWGHWTMDASPGLHLWADHDVTVVGWNHADYTTDAWTQLPTDALGTEHLLLTFDEQNFYSPYVTVVATQDDTVVTIDPPKDNLPQSKSVTLQAGQSAILYNHWSDGGMTGKRISSNNPVAVYSHHGCANVVTPACDHLAEQIPPTNTWGTDYVTVPLATRAKDWFMLIADQADTTVSITDANGTRTQILAAGQRIQWENNLTQVITADKPILVAQLSEGTLVDNVDSDPFLAFVPTVEQGTTRATLVTPSVGQNHHYLSLVTLTEARGELTIDGAAPTGDWVEVPGTPYSSLTVRVDAGSHQVAGSRPFTSMVYGFGKADSYGYVGPHLVATVAEAETLSVTPANQSATPGTTQCVTMAVTRADGSGIGSMRLDVTVTGAQAGYRSLVTDATGEAQLCLTSDEPGRAQLAVRAAGLSGSATIEWASVSTPSPTPDPTGGPGPDPTSGPPDPTGGPGPDPSGGPTSSPPTSAPPFPDPTSGPGPGDPAPPGTSPTPAPAPTSAAPRPKPSKLPNTGS